MPLGAAAGRRIVTVVPSPAQLSIAIDRKSNAGRGASASPALFGGAR
jgi:hypothetical protein